MATATDILRIAAAEVGYSRWNDPEAGTKYGRWYAGITGSSYFGASGVPYCAMFVSWVMAQAGQSCAGLPAAYCPYILRDVTNAGLVISDKTKAQPGDVVLFDWDGGVVDHIGFVELNMGSYIQTIEGNTNNGAVARRTRAWSTVTAVFRPPYGSTSGGDSGTVGLAVDGYWGPQSITRGQSDIGAPFVDGIVSRQNPDWRSILPACTDGWEWDLGDGSGSQYIKLLQQKFGVDPDGIFGPASVNGMIKHYMDRGSGATVLDGKLDAPSVTVMAYQRDLNGDL